MQQVLSSDLWKRVQAVARRAPIRKAAIAYATRDLVGFRAGDVLLLDASPRAIASGETDGRLLRVLHKKGVSLFHCPDLHAKVLLLGDVAVIGSGNMSNASAHDLVEAAVLTDNSATVSAVASLIEQLVQQSDALTLGDIERLCRIEVVRRGGGRGERRPRRKVRVAPLGNRTWLVGVKELTREPSAVEQKKIAQAEKSLRCKLRDPDLDLDWIRWSGKSRFLRECREGDTVIQIWRSSRAKRPSAVLRAVPVLLKQVTKSWTRFYLPPEAGRDSRMSWGRFQKVLKSLGYPRRVGPAIAQPLEADLADAIQRCWMAACRS